MALIQQIDIFKIRPNEILSTYPEEYIRHSTKDNTIMVGFIKTETLTLFAVRKEAARDNNYAYEIYDLSNKCIFATNSKNSNYTAKFYVIDNKEVVVDFAGKILIKSNYAVAGTDFKENMLGIPNLFLYDKNLYYHAVVIEKYCTQIYQGGAHRFYRVCYNAEKYIIFMHMDEIIMRCFSNTQQITIDQRLEYLINDCINNKEKFIDLIELSINRRFEKLDDILKYIKFINKLEVIDKEKNGVIIDIITNLLYACKVVDKSKIILLADKFV